MSIEYFKKIIKNMSNNDNSRLIFKNYSALMLLQIANFVIPLLTLPYLLNVIGPKGYGTVVFALAFISYFVLVIEFGFDYSGTREIALANNKDDMNKIFSSVMALKTILFLACLIIALILIILVPFFHQDITVYLIILVQLIFGLLNSNWVFQGLQVMKYITIINVSSRILMTIFIFLFIKNENDYYLYAIIYVLSSLLIGISSQMLIHIKLGIKFVKISLLDVKRQFDKGKHIFATTILANIMSNTGIFVLGILGTKEAVGYFSVAERLIKAVQMVFSPITKAIYPQVSQRFGVSFSNGLKFVTRSLLIILVPLIFVFLGVGICAEFIYQILFSEEHLRHSTLLSVLSFWGFLTIINNLLGIQTLIGSGHGKQYSILFTIAAICTLFSYFIFTPKFSAYGISIGMILGEAILTVLLITTIRKLKKVSVNRN